MAGKAQPVQRLYAYLDSVAIQRQAAHMSRIEQEISSAEASRDAVLLNPSGTQVHGHMSAQIAQRIGELRERLNATMELDGDDRVLTYCAAEVAQAGQPDYVELVQQDGAPLARGNYAQPVAPGMG